MKTTCLSPGVAALLPWMARKPSVTPCFQPVRRRVLPAPAVPSHPARPTAAAGRMPSPGTGWKPDATHWQDASVTSNSRRAPSTVSLAEWLRNTRTRLDGITANPDHTISLSLAGVVPGVFAPYYDIYPIEASTNMVDWSPLATLLRTNASPDALSYRDSEATNLDQRFYRTPDKSFITPFPKPPGPFPVRTVSRLMTGFRASERMPCRKRWPARPFSCRKSARCTVSMRGWHAGTPGNLHGPAVTAASFHIGMSGKVVPDQAGWRLMLTDCLQSGGIF